MPRSDIQVFEILQGEPEKRNAQKSSLSKIVVIVNKTSKITVETLERH